MKERLIKEGQIREKLGNPSKRIAYLRFYKHPDFPKPVMRTKYNLWLESDIDEFLRKLSLEAQQRDKDD